MTGKKAPPCICGHAHPSDTQGESLTCKTCGCWEWHAESEHDWQSIGPGYEGIERCSSCRLFRGEGRVTLQAIP